MGSSVRILTLVVALFFFTSSLSGSFLPVYYHDELGMNMPDIAVILLPTFLLIGLLPLVLLRTVKNFERVISYGIFLTMVFYVLLMFVRNPVVLGLANGLGIATFWPSFNLLLFRLSESGARARTVSFFSSIIPTLTGIIGPATGGFIIQSFGFTILFAATVILYVVAFLLSLKLDLKPEKYRFSVPKNRIFAIFFMTFVLLGLSEAYWLAYPLFVLGVSGTVFNMGLVLALSAILISAVTFLVSYLSDVRRIRVGFAVVGASLLAAWFIGLSFATSTYQIVALSLLDGVAAAFNITWFAHYGDSFSKQQYASILVLMETALMIGRIANLAPTLAFVPSSDFPSYFRFSAIALALLIPFYLLSKRK